MTVVDVLREPFRLLGVQFAPLYVPMERRLQTLAVVLYISIFLQGGFVCALFCLYALTTRFYYLVLLYSVWWFWDWHAGERGGRPADWVRNSFCSRWFADYFPVHLHKTADLPPDRNYLAGFHPHGILSFGASANFGTNATGFQEKFPGLSSYLILLKFHLAVPFYREFVLRYGTVSPSRRSIRWLMDRRNGVGRFAALLVGGAREALSAYPGEYNLYLRSRLGFVRIAFETGASLVPVVSFGEVDVYDQLRSEPGSFLHRLQNIMLPITGLSLPIFYGRGIFNYTYGFLPHRRPINTVVGAPIHVPLEQNPTEEMVRELHGQYVNALTELFETHKLKFGLKETDHLVIH